jgi:putative two-component system response regulator
MFKPNILVVDDERFFTSLIADILKESYHISIANNGFEALDKLKKGSIDLILLDILMPDMDGYETCKQIKLSERGHDIPVIFLTIKNEIEDELHGFSLGAVDYISPPIVKARVATHIALAKAHEQLRQHTLELELLVAERTVELTREITEKQKAYEKLHYLANYDPLTQLPNRNLFNERLAYAYKLAKRNNSSFFSYY